MVSIFIQSSIFYGVDSPLSHLLSPSVVTRSQANDGPVEAKICQSGNSTYLALSDLFYQSALWFFPTICSPSHTCLPQYQASPVSRHFAASLQHLQLVQLHVSVLHIIPREHESLDICEQLVSFKENFKNQKTKCLGYVLSACLFVHLNYRALKRGFKTFFLCQPVILPYRQV